MQVNILGVKIDDITQDEAIEKIINWVKTGGKHYVVTPNPEFIVSAQKDSEFKDIINKSDLSIPDGIGLRLTGKIINRVTGTDLMFALIERASQQGLSIGLLGGKNGVAQKSAEALIVKYPNLKITLAHEGGEVDSNGRKTELRIKNYELGEENHNSRFKTIRSQASLIIPISDILFVAFGHGKQEKWIAQNLNRIPVKVAMGVGGAFDYISGQVPRAPVLIRKLGFEWLFRLIIQPWRIKRQIALIKYLWLLMSSG